MLEVQSAHFERVTDWLKPRATNAFNTLVKTGAQVVRQQEQALHAQLRREFAVDGA